MYNRSRERVYKTGIRKAYVCPCTEKGGQEFSAGGQQQYVVMENLLFTIYNGVHSARDRQDGMMVKACVKISA